jgi:predicted transcriptional regulator
VRSKIFERALINMKIKATLNENEVKTDAPKGSSGWAPEKAFYKENVEIIGEVLTFCNDPQSKTKIMYKNNLSLEQLGSCIQYLIAQGLLAERSGEFVTTEKGLLLLELFAKLRGFFGVEPLE